MYLPWDHSFISKLRAVSFAEHDRLFEPGGHSWGYDTLEEQHEAANAYREEVELSGMFQRGLIRVMSHRDGPGFAVMVGLSSRGEAVMECLLTNRLIWNTDTRAPDPAQSVLQWRQRLRTSYAVSSSWFGIIEATTGPDLAPLRAELDEIRLHVWMRNLGRVTQHDDPIFQEIENLPPQFDVLKAEAMLQRIKVWSPL